MSHAIVFDLDDTLAITDRDRETLLSAAADRADVPLSFDRDEYRDAHRKHSGPETREPVFEALVGSDAKALTRAYRDVIGDALHPVRGAESALATLRGRYRVGLVTDGPGETQRDKLRRLGWNDVFDATVVTGPLGAPKPDNRAFETVLNVLEIPPKRAVYVGDHPRRDIEGAAAAGLTPIQVCYSDGPAPHPDAVMTIDRSDIGSLPERLEMFFGNGANHA